MKTIQHNREIIKPASRARVLFDRSAEFDREIELSLSRGDDLLIIHKQNNGWWIGKRSNAEVHHDREHDHRRHQPSSIGFFPSNHVEEIPIGDDDPIIAQGIPFLPSLHMNLHRLVHICILIRGLTKNKTHNNRRRHRRGRSRGDSIRFVSLFGYHRL